MGVQALLPPQLLLDALELRGLPLVALALGVDDTLLAPSEYALEVSEFLHEALDEVDGRLRPLVIELIKLLAGERNGKHGDGL